MRFEPIVSGIIVATLTPYDRRGRVDPGLVRDHTAFLVEQGIEALAPVGTTGEFLFLEEWEKRAVIAATVQGARGQARVVAGVWGTSAAEVVRLATAAEEAGASAVFLTTPLYYRYPEAAIEEWYRHVGREAELPVFCYNIPAYAGNEISPASFGRLAGEGAVAGIKDSTGDSKRLAAELEAAAGRAAVYGASDSFALEARRLGAHGFISALANIFPERFLAIWDGDDAAQQYIDGVRRAIKSYGGIAALKHLLSRRGFPFDGTRLPFSELSAAERTGLDRAIEVLEAP